MATTDSINILLSKIDDTIQFISTYNDDLEQDTVIEIDFNFNDFPMNELSNSLSIPSYQSTIFLDGLHFNLLDNEMNMKHLSNLQVWILDNEYDTDSLIEDIIDEKQSNLKKQFKDDKYFKIAKEYINNNMYQHHCCTQDTDKICNITNRIIKLLSVYDKLNFDEKEQLKDKEFINRINSEIFNNDIFYDLGDIVNDYYHIKTFHETNNKYMQKLHKSLKSKNSKCNQCIDLENKKEGLFGWIKLMHFHFIHWIQ